MEQFLLLAMLVCCVGLFLVLGSMSHNSKEAKREIKEICEDLKNWRDWT